MIKFVALLYRKPGMTREEFRRHYDTSHVPLVKGLMGDNLMHYIRNYTTDASTEFDVGVPPEFDCITEFHYKDMAAFKRAVAAIEDPKNAPAVRADEKRFLDVSRVQMAIVEVADNTDGKTPA